MEIAGQVSRLTGGQIYKYTYFQAPVDGDRLIEDVKRNITRPTAYDAVMRVRTSTGIRPTDFYGHMFMSNTTGNVSFLIIIIFFTFPVKTGSAFFVSFYQSALFYYSSPLSPFSVHTIFPYFLWASLSLFSLHAFCS